MKQRIFAALSALVLIAAVAGIVRAGGYSPGTQSVLFTATGSTTVTASVVGTTPTTLLGSLQGSQSLDTSNPNFNPSWRSGRAIRCRLLGQLTTSGTPPTIQIDLKIGSYVCASTGAFTPRASDTGTGWEIDALLTCRVYGGANTATVQGDGAYRAYNVAGLVTTGTNWMNKAAATSASLDLTTTNTFDVVVTYGANTAGNSITLSSAVCELVN